jgi:hypothetical protein
MRLFLVAERVQGPERVRRVPEPREAVVPVPLAADPLRERRRGRGHDCTRLRKYEQLQHQGAAQDGWAPAAFVLRAADPPGPELLRVPEAMLGVVPAGKEGRLVMGCRQREERVLAFAELQLAVDPGAAHARLAGSPGAEGDRVSTGGREHPGPPALDPRPLAPEEEAGLDAPGKCRGARQALDLAHDLPLRHEHLSGRKRHRVGDPGCSG